MTAETTDIYLPISPLREAIAQAEARGHRFTRQLWLENYAGRYGKGRQLCCDAWCFCAIVVREDGTVTGGAIEEDCLYGPEQKTVREG